MERWDIEQLYAPDNASGKMYTRHAAWLAGVEHFDASMFGFSKSQAVATDPQVPYNANGPSQDLKCC